MSFDAAQILRKTYAAGAEAMQQMSDLTNPVDTEDFVERGELKGTALVVEDDPDADLMDSLEELTQQFEE